MLFVNVLAFDAQAHAALLALSDGDAVSLAGTLTPEGVHELQLLRVV